MRIELRRQPQEGSPNLRVRYMLNQIDKKHFQNTLYANHKKDKKNAELYDLVEMYTNVTEDLLTQLATRSINLKEFFEQHEQSMTYTKEQYDAICKLYGSKRPIFFTLNPLDNK